MSQTEFKPEQFLAIYPPGIERHYWTLARNLIIKKELKRLDLHSRRLLEIGCGRGVVVDFLRQAGFDCHGVELASVEPLPGVTPYIHSGIEFSSLDKNFSLSIEVVLLLDVIEHLPDDASFLKRVRQSFPNAEYLIITVPARQELWSNYDVFNGHYRRYALAQLRQSMRQGGWQSLRASYFFHTLYLPARLLLQVFGKRQTKIIPPVGAITLLHKILAGFFAFDHFILPSHYLGTSIMAAARREDKKPEL